MGLTNNQLFNSQWVAIYLITTEIGSLKGIYFIKNRVRKRNLSLIYWSLLLCGNTGLPMRWVTSITSSPSCSFWPSSAQASSILESSSHRRHYVDIDIVGNFVFLVDVHSNHLPSTGELGAASGHGHSHQCSHLGPYRDPLSKLGPYLVSIFLKLMSSYFATSAQNLCLL